MALDTLLGTTSNRDQGRALTCEQKELLMVPFDLDEIIEASKRSPAKSSPGSDGLPYEILNILINHPAVSNLILKLYNGALLNTLFPTTWNQSLMTLIPKKGDLSQVGNHRPIQLVNTDSGCHPAKLR
jgi:hypothetical protein